MKESSNKNTLSCPRRSDPRVAYRGSYTDWWMVACALFILLVFPGSVSSQQPPPPASTPAPVVDQPIPLPLVSTRAEELGRSLRELEKRLTTEQDLGSLEEANQVRDQEIREKIRETDALIAGVPKLLELRELEWYWRVQRAQQAAPLNKLTRQANLLEKDLLFLEGQKAQWEATLKQIQDRESFKSVVDLIRGLLADIRRAQSRVRAQLSLLLTVQNRFSQQDRLVSEVLERIGDTRNQFQARLLERDSPTLWGAWSAGSRDSFGKLLYDSMSREAKSSKVFTQANGSILSAFLVILVVSLLIALALKRRVSGRLEQQVQIFQHPGSLALLTALLFSFLLMPAAPVSVVSLVGLLFLIPVLRLLPPLVRPVFRLPLYWLSAFSVAIEIQRLVEAAPHLERTVQAVIVAGAIVLLAHLGRLLKSGPLVTTPFVMRLLFHVVRWALAVLTIALVCNLAGYFGLSRVLAEATILSGYVAIVLYTTVRVLASLTWLVFQTNFVQRLISVRLHGERIIRRVVRLLALAAAAVWLVTTLDLFTIRQQIFAVIASTLKVSVSLGKVSFSVGDVLSFALILIVGFLFASLLRFILREEVLSRIPLQRGLPNAVSTLAHYLVLLLVFLLALAGAGVDLSRFTLLTGAFGVGIGFGLQNVVNNFVSGLILLFERYINVGDTIEVGQLSGEITRIGIRSSTVRTFQGAELLVPNANLVSNQVTNWTLSDLRRRVDLPVGVAYGTDIETVLRLLVSVARSHPGVLRDPEPAAVFQGFGDSALSFELRFWAPKVQTHLLLKNEVAIGIVKALNEAGIEIPFPQRDLHIKEAPYPREQAREALASTSTRSKTSESAVGLTQKEQRARGRHKEGESESL